MKPSDNIPELERIKSDGGKEGAATPVSPGLTSAEARGLADVHGANVIPARSRASVAALFLLKFGSPVVFAMLGAAALTAYFGDVVVGVVILLTTLAHAALGTILERRRDDALSAIAKMVPDDVCVRRGGDEARIAAAALVPGDTVVLRKGDIVAADLSIVFGEDFLADESAIYGKAARLRSNFPIGSKLYMGSEVTRGFAECIVSATGSNTKLGKAASEILEIQKPASPIQAGLDRILCVLALAAAAAAAVAFSVGAAIGRPAAFTALACVSIIVAAAPTGAKAVALASLAAARSRMSRNGVSATNWRAPDVFGLSRVAIIDKAGFMAERRLAVKKLWTKNAAMAQACMLAHNNAYCADAPAEEDGAAKGAGGESENAAKGRDGDASAKPGARFVGEDADIALIEYLVIRGGVTEGDIKRRERVGEIPYDAERRVSSVAVKLTERDDGQDGFRVYVKGDADVIVSRSTHIQLSDGIEPLTDAALSETLSHCDDVGGCSQQVTAFAYRDFGSRWYGSFDEIPEPEAGLVFIGVVGLASPARKDTRAAVASSLRNGVATIMITGDDIGSAVAAAQEYGLVTEAPDTRGSFEKESTAYPDSPVKAPDLDSFVAGACGAANDEVETASVKVDDAANADARLSRFPQTVSCDEFLSMDDEGREVACSSASVFAGMRLGAESGVVAAARRLAATTLATGAGAPDAPAMRSSDASVCEKDAPAAVLASADAILSGDGGFASIVAAMDVCAASVEAELRAFRYLVSCAVATAGVALVGALTGWPILTPGRALFLSAFVAGLAATPISMAPCGNRSRGGAKSKRLEKFLFSRKEQAMMYCRAGVMAATAVAAFAVFRDGAGGDAAFCALAAAILIAALIEWIRNLMGHDRRAV